MPPVASHFVHRAAWLRAAVLGANDGIISTASLIVGVAASGAGRAAILTAAAAGWAAGAMAMAAGEYVSVGSQADSEAADMERERRALENFPEIETIELSEIYQRRGLAPALARQVAEQLMATDALGAHARDELGLGNGAAPTRCSPARLGGRLLGRGGVADPGRFSRPAGGDSRRGAGGLARLSRRARRARRLARRRAALKPTLRVAFWGALAMAVTAGIGALIGKAV